MDDSKKTGPELVEELPGLHGRVEESDRAEAALPESEQRFPGVPPYGGPWGVGKAPGASPVDRGGRLRFNETPWGD
jgi:hypothetical protein